MSTSVQYGSQQIDFELTYADRKTLGITVLPDAAVQVKAPFNTPLESIHEKILAKAPWILRQQLFFKSFEPRRVPKRYVGGETHHFLGRAYKLQIHTAPETDVVLNGLHMELYTPDKSRAMEALEQWFYNQALEKLPLLALKPIKKFKKHGVQPKDVVVRKMANRWGSCTKAGKILLNAQLIHVPRACIEYVIVHELCHLIHHDHTAKFWELLQREMPDWKKWKHQLEYLMA